MEDKENFKDTLKVNINEIEDFVYSITDHHSDYTTNEFNSEYIQNIEAAIFLQYRKMYPGIDIFIQIRDKSERSLLKNIDKTLAKTNLNGSDELLDDAKKDIVAMRVILSHVPNALSFDYTDPENAKIVEEQNRKIDNLNFINDLTQWMAGNTSDLLDEENFYKYYVEILDRLQKASYEECVNEVEIPYAERYEKAKEKAETLKKNGQFDLFVSDENMHELSNLRNNLIAKLDDKLQNEILDVTLPKVLEGELVKDILKVSSTRDNSSSKDNGWLRKPNAYVSLYHNLSTNSGLEIELQAQSYQGYRNGKNGMAYHNGMKGKRLNLDYLFELVDKNDDKPLEYYIQLLDNTSADLLISKLAQKQLSPRDQLAFEALKHIKIVDSVKVTPNKTNAITSENDENIENQGISENSNPTYIDINQYLLELSEFAAPKCYICRGAHNVTRSAASIEKKQTVENFSDILRKKNGISCLSQMLLDKIEDIVQNDSQTIQISERDILKFAEKNQDKINPTPQKNNEQDIDL